MHTVFTAHVEALLAKWHREGFDAIVPADLAALEREYLAERMRHDEGESAIEEFVDALNSPRGDAADQRRTAALGRLRAARQAINDMRNK